MHPYENSLILPAMKRYFPLVVISLLLGSSAVAQPTSLLDQLTPGNDSSETSHQLTADKSETVDGALHQPARRLLPGGEHAWEGGHLRFMMKVDPKLPTYLTARFWGDQPNPNSLILFCEGKQVGYRHLGDIDMLAAPDDEPRYKGRFYYLTTPLPRAMTAGKTQISLEIRSYGPVWGYAKTFDQYQKPMTQSSRPIYRVYTHTDGCFVPPAEEVQGEAPASTPRQQPGPEVLDQVKQRVNSSLNGMLKSKRPLNQMQAEFLARAYFVKWTVAYQNPKVIEQVTRCADDRYHAWKSNPDTVWHDNATWNPDWFGLGPLADAVRLLEKPLAASRSEKLDSDKSRNEAWSGMFQSSRDWLRTHQRWLTNQALFTGVNLYLSNRAVAAIDPPHALAENKTRDYLYQAAGLVPFLGNEVDGIPQKPIGSHFHQVTQKGLTRELGYVGGYGEVGVAGVMNAYDATREPSGEGDPKLKAQLAKMIRARGPFRYPGLDDDNHPAMRLETAIGWRDVHFPGPVDYIQPGGGEQSIFSQAAATLDPDAIGYAQQMLAENQFFASVASALESKSFRATFGLLSLPDDYALIRSQPESPHRLPMSTGQGDFVFTDEEDGVIALKHGPDILYASLYWRSRAGINGLARIHLLTPRHQQLAVVYEDVKFDPSGQTWKRPNWTNFGFANGGFKYPGKLDSALAGEELPIPKLPPDAPQLKGKDNPYAGRADFYQLRYGPYLIAMNTTKEKTFEVTLRNDPPRAFDLVANRKIELNEPIKVAPLTTTVLFFVP
jgi:hypothetical protein